MDATESAPLPVRLHNHARVSLVTGDFLEDFEVENYKAV
tara:strand:+ start:4706 stop:4822 length:117 start_codon:yes stop_codon:yes gene_type:complete